jgi:hypothetical protein
MKPYFWIGITLLFISFLADGHANCRIPKEHVTCSRQCFYNPYGPGVHCNEQCIKTKMRPEMVVYHAGFKKKFCHTSSRYIQ